MGHLTANFVFLFVKAKSKFTDTLLIQIPKYRSRTLEKQKMIVQF